MRNAALCFVLLGVLLGLGYCEPTPSYAGFAPAGRAVRAPLPAPPPADQQGPRLTRAEVRRLLEPYGWDPDEMLIVVFGPTPACPHGESNGYPAAISPAGQRGLLQLDGEKAWRFERRGWTWDDALDPERNIAIGAELFDEEGLGPWSCRP